MIHGNKYDNLFQQNRVNHMKNEIELRQDEIKEYILLISHVGKDENIALQIVAAIEEKNKDFEVTDKIRIIPIYMEKEVDSCHGDFIKWSAEAVERADGVLAIITKNTAEAQTTPDGYTANVKVVYSEISYARNKLKDIVLLREADAVLDSAYNLLLVNIKCQYTDWKDLRSDISLLINDVILHAKDRFAGKPLLEYAGKINVMLSPSNIEDTSAYLGRVKEIADIDRYFNEGKNIVCITGFGGIGKTTLAKMYAKFHPEIPVIIHYCSSKECDLRNAVINLKVENDILGFMDLPFEEKFEVRINQLKKVGGKTLIIIDNFNADFAKVYNIMTVTALSAIPNCNFLISSRQTLRRAEVGLIDVGKLDDEELIELFYNYSHCAKTSENNKAIHNLIVATNGHTMTVELAAKAVGDDTNDVTPREIADKLLSSDAEVRLDDRYDGYDEYKTIYQHLRTLFNISNINGRQKQLLGALSFVSRHGLTVKELKICEIFDREALRYLCSLGYIEKSEGECVRYSLHPLMSDLAFIDFVSAIEPFKSTIGFLIDDKAHRSSNDTLTVLEIRLSYAEQIYLRLSSLKSDLICNRIIFAISCGRIGDIYEAKGDMASAEEYRIKAYILSKKIAEETGTIEASYNLAACCEKLGDIYQAREIITAAEEYHKQAYEILKTIAEETQTLESYHNLVTSCERLGNIYQIKGDITTSEEFHKQAYNISKMIAEDVGTIEARLDLATSCGRLGQIYEAHGDIVTAEVYYRQFYEISKSIDQETDTIEVRRYIIISCELLGDINQVKGDILSAEEFRKQAYNISKMIAEDAGTIETRRYLATSCEKLGDLYIFKSDIASAEEYHKQAYEIFKAIAEETEVISVRRSFAANCGRLGNLYLVKGDKTMAEEYYIKAYEIFKTIAEETGMIEDSRWLHICCNKIGEIYIAQGNIAAAQEYYMEYYEISKTIAEETGTIDALKDFIVSNINMSYVAQCDEDELLYAKKAFDLAKILYDNDADVEGMYEYIAQRLLEFYKKVGNEECYLKMQKILKNIK